MAVDLSYRHASGEVVLHTIATSDAFQSQWQKAAHRLRLELVGKLALGITLDRDGMLRLLDELSQLARWVHTKPDLLARVHDLAAELRRALQAGASEASFG